MPGFARSIRASFPLSRRGVRGKLSIGEVELILVVALRSWDGGGVADFGDGAAFEELRAYQIGEAQGRQVGSAALGGDAQQEIGDHRGDDLQAMAFSLRPRKVLILRCCLTQRNNSSIC